MAHTMAEDRARGELVVFGGLHDNFRDIHVSDATWIWNGSTWQRRHPSRAPSARWESGSCWDEANNRIVLFGAGPAPSNETWVWDGRDWAELPIPPQRRPPGRAKHVLAFHPVRRSVILFGGGFVRNDTWELTGQNWLQLAPANSPPPRMQHACASDPTGNRIVVFGGVDNARQLLGDTWAFDGSNWTQIAMGGSGPAARQAATMTFDPRSQSVILFGGYDTQSSQALFGDTWSLQGDRWVLLDDVHTPPPRNEHAMVYDEARDRVVMYGGRGYYDDLADTWEYARGTWTRITAANNIAVRRRAATAFWRGKVYVFSGYEAAADLWFWDGSTWTLIYPTPRPSPRSGAAMAPDRFGRLILFGGSGDDPPRETWAFDGTAWQRLTSIFQEVPGRSNAAMAYDPHRERTVMFGGGDEGFVLEDLWEWDGNRWWLRLTTPRPPGRGHGRFVYDFHRRRMVLSGGVDAAGRAMGDIWEWDGERWYERQPSGFMPARWEHGAVYLPNERKTMIFGGRFTNAWRHADTWFYGPTVPATYEQFGAGCGLPALALAAPHTLPWLGDELRVEVRNLRAGQVGAFGFGTSRSSWGGLRLPFDLGPFGMPGCTLWTSLDELFPFVSGGSSATWSAAVPPNPGLLGQRFYNQALVLEPGANQAGVVVSNACEGRIGQK
jgi:hypothetical protein